MDGVENEEQFDKRTHQRVNSCYSNKSDKFKMEEESKCIIF